MILEEEIKNCEKNKNLISYINEIPICPYSKITGVDNDDYYYLLKHELMSEIKCPYLDRETIEEIRLNGNEYYKNFYLKCRK